MCSKHFKDSDFEKIGLLKRIKVGILPSLNLPTKSDEKQFVNLTELLPVTSEVSNITSALLKGDQSESVPSTSGLSKELEILPSHDPETLRIQSSPSLIMLSSSQSSTSDTENTENEDDAKLT